MADIDTCMIKKFVQRARQIHKFPFDDKEFCPVGLQCFKLTSMERNYYFLPAFLFKMKIGFKRQQLLVLIHNHVKDMSLSNCTASNFASSLGFPLPVKWYLIFFGLQ